MNLFTIGMVHSWCIWPSAPLPGAVIIPEAPASRAARGGGTCRHPSCERVRPLRFSGNDRWLFGLCLSRVGTFMVYISYAAALPVLQREWHMSGTAAGSIASMSSTDTAPTASRNQPESSGTPNA